MDIFAPILIRFFPENSFDNEIASFPIKLYLETRRKLFAFREVASREKLVSLLLWRRLFLLGRYKSKLLIWVQFFLNSIVSNSDNGEILENSWTTFSNGFLRAALADEQKFTFISSCCLQGRITITLMYKKYILPHFFLLLPEMYRMMEWRRESKMAEMFTQGKIRIFSEPLLRSAFGKLVQGHLLALNHSFFSLLYFRNSRQDHLKVPNHLSFYSLFYFPEFGTALAFLYLSTLGSLVQGYRQETV